MGVALGAWRARLMLVGRVEGSWDVILRRSPLEYGLLVVLIVARSLEGAAVRAHASWALPVFAGLVSFALVESIARAAVIVARCQWGRRLPATYGLDPGVDGSTT